MRNEKILRSENTALLIIDVQERILKVMRKHENLMENLLKLLRGFKVMQLPVFYTEQYPKGLGPTVAELKDELSEIEAVQKMSFSCSGAGDLFDDLKKKNIEQVVVCGIESHVCVQQTVLDLISAGFQVDVAADGVSSRKKIDYKIALERMRQNGAEVTTVESILFELLNVCGTDQFKAVSKLVK